jgi:hypothetical protein
VPAEAALFSRLRRRHLLEEPQRATIRNYHEGNIDRESVLL